MITWIRPCAAGRQSSSSTNLLVKDQLLGSQQGMGGIGGVGARHGVVSAEMMSYEEGRPGGFDPHKRIPDMDLDGIAGATDGPIGLDPQEAAVYTKKANRARLEAAAAPVLGSTRHGNKSVPLFRRLRPVGQAGRKRFDNQLCFSVVASPRGFEPTLWSDSIGTLCVS
jgi:hypothetical protein